MPLNPSDQTTKSSRRAFKVPKPKVGEVDVPKKKCSTKSQREIGGIKSWMGGTILIDFCCWKYVEIIFGLLPPQRHESLDFVSDKLWKSKRGRYGEPEALCVDQGPFFRFYHWFVLVPFQGLLPIKIYLLDLFQKSCASTYLIILN